MATTDVVWDMSSDGVLVTKDKQTTILRGQYWDTDGGCYAAQEIAEDYVRPSLWDEWIGPDDYEWVVEMEIYQPAALAGKYEVELRRIVKANARLLEPTDT